MAAIPLALTDEQRALKAGVAEICKRYPGEYWRELDAKREYPEAFVTELTPTGAQSGTPSARTRGRSAACRRSST